MLNKTNKQTVKFVTDLEKGNLPDIFRVIYLGKISCKCCDFSLNLKFYLKG